ncbi:hypothetical protein Tsubulata_045782 [Turnera subulata]|uniref:Uncharacterized protein n=1 Tax=Turnera subulata TaxID=218843 RepID=A0A9Q0G3B4_9ROSI|nr:hypothetical protein Tsubulata_045782 [Turnera subulata]
MYRHEKINLANKENKRVRPLNKLVGGAMLLDHTVVNNSPMGDDDLEYRLQKIEDGLNQLDSKIATTVIAENSKLEKRLQEQMRVQFQEVL